MRKPAASTIWEYGRKYHGRIYGGRFKLCIRPSKYIFFDKKGLFSFRAKK